MRMSVGQLYSAQQLLGWVSNNSITPVDIEASDIRTVLVCPAADVLEVVMRGGWAIVDISGELKLTERGNYIYSLGEEIASLREQLRDLITFERPVWLKLISRGREELKKFVPSEVKQVLQEAGVCQHSCRIKLLSSLTVSRPVRIQCH